MGEAVHSYRLGNAKKLRRVPELVKILRVGEFLKLNKEKKERDRVAIEIITGIPQKLQNLADYCKEKHEETTEALGHSLQEIQRKREEIAAQIKQLQDEDHAWETYEEETAQRLERATESGEALIKFFERGKEADHFLDFTQLVASGLNELNNLKKQQESGKNTATNSEDGEAVKLLKVGDTFKLIKKDETGRG